MRFKKLKICAAAFFAASAVGACTVSVSAQSNPDESTGTVAFTVIKSSIGQGFAVEPMLVELHEGDTGFDIIERSGCDFWFEDGDYGKYITAFGDTDTKSPIPDEIAAVCPEMTAREKDAWLQAGDYTPESGWSYFINGEYAQVGIGDYVPKSGDVLEFRFTVYGYGADLGIDNSSWGGAAALTEQVNASQLIGLCAQVKDMGESDDKNYTSAMETLGKYGVTQSEIDTATDSLAQSLIMPISAETKDQPEKSEPDKTEPEDGSVVITPEKKDDSIDKFNPDTGAEGLAVVFGAVILAGGAIALSRRK